jgi:3,4-dihydroxy 2-butanone 4-phosphate synthase/GTP cyclohydrolase II
MNRDRGIPNVEGALEDVRTGRIVILVDDEDRENEGDLCMAAERVTPDAINFMATHGRGLICLPMTEDRIRQLDLPMMVRENQARMGTAFTVSIEAKIGVTTGISAADRAHTIQVAVAPGAKADDLVRPGHVFPLRARAGGVLQRSGQTEGAVDLARLAGLVPAGVICEIMNDDGSMARMPDLERFAALHGLRIVTIAELIEYRMQKERLVRRVTEADLHFEGLSGAYRAYAYESTTGGRFLAIVRGEVEGGGDPVLCRVHTGCLTGDVFGSRTCDCGAQLRAALLAIDGEGRGVILYLPPNPDIGREIEQHVLHRGTTSADPGPELREFGLGAQVLRDIGLTRIRLLTNNPRKIVGLEGFGLDIVERVPHEATPTPDNVALLEEKRDRWGHLIDLSRKRG